MAFLGDTLLGGEGEETLSREGYDYALAELRDLLAGTDLVVANHEGPVTARDAPADKGPGRNWWYRAEPASLGALRAAGVRVVSLANNHMLDYGPAGLADTLRAFDNAGIERCGAGMTRAEARRAAFAHAGDVRVGFVAAMARYEKQARAREYASETRPGPHMLNEERMTEDLGAVRGAADVSVVLVHWGRNYRPVADSQRRWAGVLRAAGADLVIGHHPHIAQGVDVRERCPVAYSIGNAAFGSSGRFAKRGVAPYGLLVIAEVQRGQGVIAMELHLLHVDNLVVDYGTRLVNDLDFLWSLVDGRWARRGDALRWER